MSDATLKNAIELLNKNNATCVILSNGEPIVSYERGVKPLLRVIDKKQALSGSVAADKVVGKAAAYLYVLLNIKEIFCQIISKPAIEVLQKNGIKVFYNSIVERIENRTKDGFCPMEEAVLNCNSPKESYFLIKEKLKSLQK